MDHLDFAYKAGRNFKLGKYHEGSLTLPYAIVFEVFYGQEKDFLDRGTAFSSLAAGTTGFMLMVAKSRAHYVAIVYANGSGSKEKAAFEVSGDAIRPVLSLIEARTGKKVQYALTSVKQAVPAK